MNFQIVPAPTNEMAIGMKMIDLASFSPLGDSLSASVAMTRPMTTVTAGTIAIHSRLLISVVLEVVVAEHVLVVLEPDPSCAVVVGEAVDDRLDGRVEQEKPEDRRTPGG